MTLSVRTIRTLSLKEGSRINTAGDGRMLKITMRQTDGRYSDPSDLPCDPLYLIKSGPLITSVETDSLSVKGT
jgi:hypothetical protein